MTALVSAFARAYHYRSNSTWVFADPFAEAMLMPLSGADRNAIAESILKYIEFHTESAVNVRSLAVLREIYG